MHDKIRRHGQGIEMQSLWLDNVIFPVSCVSRLILPVSPLSDNPSADWQLTRGKLDEPENREHQPRHALYKAWETEREQKKKTSGKLKTEAIRKGDGGQRGLWENVLATKNKKGCLIAPQHEGKKTRAQKLLWLIKRSLTERSAKDNSFFSPRRDSELYPLRGCAVGFSLPSLKRCA